MKRETGKITLTAPEDSAAVELYVLEQTRLGGRTYLLAAEEAEGDGEAYILQDLSGDGDPEAVYRFVEEESELEALSGIFAQMLDDVEFTAPDNL